MPGIGRARTAGPLQGARLVASYSFNSGATGGRQIRDDTGHGHPLSVRTASGGRSATSDQFHGTVDDVAVRIG